MTKLITAKEAIALSTPGEDIDRHIEYVNLQIQYATRHQERVVDCVFWCDMSMMCKIADRLTSVGYSASWHMRNESCGYMIITW